MSQGFTPEELAASGDWAFPCRHTPEHSPGMTLRDYFAAQAVVGLVDRWGPCLIPKAEEIARFAFLLADEMLKLRSPKIGDQQIGDQPK
jgi:hypothetical protein